jgi:hypothetical protein
MAKRIPRADKPCEHDVAQWGTVGAGHQLRCCRCQWVLDRAFGGAPKEVGVVLFKTPQGYAPFDPKGWVM